MGHLSNMRTAIGVAALALVAAMAGTAIAGDASTSAINKKKVKKIATKQANKEIDERLPLGTQDIADGAVTGDQVANKSLTGADIDVQSLGLSTGSVVRTNTRTLSLLAGQNENVTANCNAGEHATGGGADSSNVTNLDLRASRPASSGIGVPATGWTATFEWDAAENNAQITAFVVCESS